MEREQKEFERLFSNDKMLVLDYKETFFLSERILEEKIYCDGKNMHFYMFEDKHLLTELLISDGFIWEIINGKKKKMNEIKFSGSFFSFWWTFVNPEDLNEFSEIEGLYFCEDKNHKYKFLFDKEYELKQIEISLGEMTIRYKINQNKYVKDFEIPFYADSIVYQDSIAIKQSILSNCILINRIDEMFSYNQYKNFTFFDSLKTYIHKSRIKK